AHAYICEGWVVPAHYNSTAETWIPRIMVRKTSTGTETLASTFVAVIEPYENKSNIKSIRRLPLESLESAPFSDANVAVEIQLADGAKDLIAASDVENPRNQSPAWKPNQLYRQPEWNLQTDGQWCWIRSAPDTPRVCRMEQEDLVGIRKKLDAHIKKDYLRKVQAPAGVKPVLRAWMELN
ncbi:hypothetical protein LCGC14_0983090, partial [marine sediment metagenome]